MTNASAGNDPAQVEPLGLAPAGRRELFSAILSVGADLDLRVVLERIVTEASRLVRARYGALGVINEHRQVTEFVTYGVTPEEYARIGDPPRGRGILGLLIDEPRPIRLERLSDHPRSYGFPANHPEMTTFLGVPIHVGNEVFGNLYLCDKEGGEPFTEQDENLVIDLAAAAGIAVVNARRYAASERGRRWMQASAEITATMLGRIDRDRALRAIVGKVRDVTQSSLALLALENDNGELIVEVTGGIPDLTGTRLERSGLVGEVLASMEPLAVDDIDQDPELARLPEAPFGGYGSALLVPTTAPDGGEVLLLLASKRGSGCHLGRADLEPARNFAAQTALVLDRVQAEADRAALAVYADRDRIARDLHDLVIQRLFATGLQLQGAIRYAIRPEVSERISAAVDDLDATIRDIRATIFALHRQPGDTDLRGALSDLVVEAASTLGFVPALVIEGPVEHMVPDRIRPDLFAVLREALSNVARHARATRADVHVAVADGELVATVRDDGRGLDPGRRESGLRNLRDRAEENGGKLDVASAVGGGTELVWRVPIR